MLITGFLCRSLRGGQVFLRERRSKCVEKVFEMRGRRLNYDLCVCVCVCLSLCPPIPPAIFTSVRPPVRHVSIQSVCPVFISLLMYLCFCLYVCPSICICILTSFRSSVCRPQILPLSFSDCKNDSNFFILHLIY